MHTLSLSLLALLCVLAALRCGGIAASVCGQASTTAGAPDAVVMRSSACVDVVYPCSGAQIVVDFDDTITLALFDRRFPRGTVYPGVTRFLSALRHAPHNRTTVDLNGDVVEYDWWRSMFQPEPLFAHSTPPGNPTCSPCGIHPLIVTGCHGPRCLQPPSVTASARAFPTSSCPVYMSCYCERSW